MHLGLLPLPFAPGQPVQLGGLPLGADVLLHPVQLVGGHIQLVAALVLDVEKIPEGALAGQAHGAHVPADAVALVDHVVPYVQVGEGGNFLPRGGPGRLPVLAGAEDVPLGDHRQLEIGVQKAPG